MINTRNIKRSKGLTGYLLLILLILHGDLLACLNPVSINDRVDNATQIVVGKVIQATSQWDAARTNIYTIYTVQSNTLLKQSNTYSYLDIVVPGGVVEDEAQVMSPQLKLTLAQDYLFFLSPSATLFENTPNPFNPSYELYSYVQGSLPLKGGVFQDYFGSKPISYHTMLNYIEERTGFEPLIHSTTLPDLETNNSISRRPNRNTSNIRSTFTLTNGAGTPTNTFYAGRIEADHYMVINGSGFGNEVGTIQFANGDNGGQNSTAVIEDSDIVSWTNTEIQVKIPFTAGTGTMQVFHKDATSMGEQEIEILWALKPIYSTYKNFAVPTRQFINFTDFNGLGGYTLLYNTPSGLSTNNPAKAAFERALDTWNCKTGIHFTVGSESTNEGPEKDDLSTIMFQIDMPRGVVAMTSSRYKASGSTSCDLFNTTWYLREFDMEFAHPDNMLPGLSWSYDMETVENEEFDFETIALHELGHAHGLGHINDPSSSMYYSIENGKIKRSLSNQEIGAGLYQMEHSKTDNCIASKLAMKEHPNFCGDQLTENATARIKLLLEGFYDEEGQEMRTDLVKKNLLSPTQPFNIAPFYYNGQEQLTDIPTNMVDWVLVNMRDGKDYNNILCLRAAILHSDGTLRMVNGDENITFDCKNEETYYISINHRNHLSVLSKNAISLDINSPVIDFSTSTDAAYGDEQLKSIDNQAFLYSGDFDCNGVINNEDYNVWKINGANINVYSSADADGNGIISSLDYNLWKTNRSKIGILTDQ